jgi:hypothetical protein
LCRRPTYALRRLANVKEGDRARDAIRALGVIAPPARGKVDCVHAHPLHNLGFALSAVLSGESRLLGVLDDAWPFVPAWAYNPVTREGRHFTRRRGEFFISRARFLKLYGGSPVRARSAPLRRRRASARPLAPGHSQVDPKPL